jgi:hypothetical protein
MSAAQAGQVVITQGGTYTFTVGNPDPTLSAVSIQTTDMVTLKDCVIYLTYQVADNVGHAR